MFFVSFHQLKLSFTFQCLQRNWNAVVSKTLIHRFSQGQKRNSHGNVLEMSFWVFWACDHLYTITGERRTLENTSPHDLCTWASDTVMSNWSVSALFSQLSIDHNNWVNWSHLCFVELALKGLASKGRPTILVTDFRFLFSKYRLLVLFGRCWLLFLLSHWLAGLPRVCVSLVNL